MKQFSFLESFASIQAVANIVSTSINRYIGENNVLPDDVVSGLTIAILRCVALFPDAESAKIEIIVNANELKVLARDLSDEDANTGKLLINNMPCL